MKCIVLRICKFGNDVNVVFFIGFVCYILLLGFLYRGLIFIRVKFCIVVFSMKFNFMKFIIINL